MDEHRTRYIVFIIIIIAAILISFARMYVEDMFVTQNPDCAIEYGRGRCVEDVLRVPFYNPNPVNIDRIKITVPFGVETNITLPADFTVSSPLAPKSSGVLSLFECHDDIDVGDFSLEWCCGGECYRTKMRWPSPKLGVAGGEGD